MTGPVIAKAGTVTEICVAESTLNCTAATPPKLTKALESNLEPVITITPPGASADREKDWTVGLVAEGEEFSLVELDAGGDDEFSPAGVFTGGGVEFPLAEDGNEFSLAGLFAEGNKFPPFKPVSPPESPPPQPANIEPLQSTVAVCALFCKNCLREFSVTADSVTKQFDFMKEAVPLLNFPS
ncbi:hypothetical protein NWF24_15925 [Variovorax paradoxus]|uniref:hypothetical protein n=1 Tax=Variovorax paradoxus TaxID=34073 RepID=UPI0021AC55B0|nr:hypothetical protein [Variovorax paradoxus]UVH60846.1 hypothetical protein NWF24_15925 [Variovorax paradoxus]